VVPLGVLRLLKDEHGLLCTLINDTGGKSLNELDELNNTSSLLYDECH